VVDGLGLIAPLLAVLPPPLLALIQGGATSANDLQASNVPGMTVMALMASHRAGLARFGVRAAGR
jgi:hypothetical protein